LSADFSPVKAFASIMLAAALLFPLVLFLSVQAKAGAEAEASLTLARAAEANHYEGEDTLNAAFGVMKQVATERKPRDARSVRETLEEIGGRLAGLEAFAEKQGAEDGIEVDFWCGKFSEDEKAGLVRKMAAERKALKCPACFDAMRPIVMGGVSADGSPKVKVVMACAFFTSIVPALGGGGQVGVGNSLLVHSYDEEGTFFTAPEFDAAGIFPTSQVAIGVSVYDGRTGAASVSYISEGKARDYS